MFLDADLRDNDYNSSGSARANKLHTLIYGISNDIVKRSVL